MAIWGRIWKVRVLTGLDLTNYIGYGRYKFGVGFDGIGINI